MNPCNDGTYALRHRREGMTSILCLPCLPTNKIYLAITVDYTKMIDLQILHQLLLSGITTGPNSRFNRACTN